MDKQSIIKSLRSISKDEAQEDYKKFQDTNPGPERNRIGLKALDYFFFPIRLEAKNQNGITFFDALKDPHILQRINDKIEKIRNKSIKELEKAGNLLKVQYNIFQLYYGAVNQFPPTIAKYVYTKYAPKHGILDFSAGWGGRCLAALSLDIPYYGFDSNKKLKPYYEKMVDMYNPNAKIVMNYIPSEKADFSKYNYDLIFTSPPYFMIEKYPHMQEYKDKQDFIDTFFVPVVLQAFTHLKVGGHMALNMPEEMYTYIKGCLPRLHTTLKLPLQNRYGKDSNRKKNVILKGQKERFEYIYVWKKTKSQTRKNTSTCGKRTSTRKVH